MSYIDDSLSRLKAYCEGESFKGYDPFDGLNSQILKIIPLNNFRLFRLFWLQFFKNFPINLRNEFLVPKQYNPKALALFLSGYANLYRLYGRESDRNKIDYLASILLKLCSKGYEWFCWGYNFDWQSRVFFIPKFSPNVIVSAFVGNAFLDLYEIFGEKKYLDMAKSISGFILQRLNRSYDKEGDFCFSYSPLDNSMIFNASLLASAYLARIFYFTKDAALSCEAKKSVRFSVKHQNQDGSWFYGLNENQRWIDGFHTGYNLEAIYSYGKFTQDTSYEKNFNAGLNYYLDNFFTKEGMPKYYNDSIYPIDAHSAAQLIILLSKTGLFKERFDLATSVLGWTIKNMQDKKGFFYYQIRRHYTIKIPYIRWSQSWMFLALSYYLKEMQKGA